jgi:hypothetical protein
MVIASKQGTLLRYDMIEMMTVVPYLLQVDLLVNPTDEHSWLRFGSQ